MNKFKVCHVTSAHPRYDTRIFRKECVSLSKSGFQVTLVVNDNLSDETKDGVRIISTGNKFVSRLERFTKGRSALIRKLEELESELYHFHDPDLLPIAMRMKKKGYIVIFDSHEDVPRQIEDKQWIPSPFRKLTSRVYRGYEEKICRQLDAVIGTTPQITDRFEKFNCNTTLVTNYPILANRINKEKNTTKVVLVYAGSISEQYKIKEIVSILPDLEGVVLKLAGAVEEDYLNQMKTLPGWNKVEFLGRISFSEVVELYRQSDIGVCVLKAFQFPEGTLGNTKIFEMLMYSLPVVCSDNKIWKSIINKNNCGVCVDPDNLAEIKEGISMLCDSPELRDTYSSNGRQAVEEKYNWSSEERKLLNLYLNLLDAR